MNGPAIEKARKRLGMNRTDLAHAVGVSERTIYRWESNEVEIRRPNVKLLRIVLGRKRAARKVA